MYTQWFFLRQMADLTMKNIHIYTVSVYYVQYSMETSKKICNAWKS